MPDAGEPDAVVRRHIVVRGTVQGVGFRRYVRNWARRLDLAGWVQNQPEGTVEVVAEGTEASLTRLLRLLHGGPPGARVTDVESRPDAGAPLEGFVVRR
jgi:acylphosphatase